MLKPIPTLKVVFYKESNGNEPVRKWLKSLTEELQFIIGTDIKKRLGSIQGNTL
jgi:hypothetical protein